MNPAPGLAKPDVSINIDGQPIEFVDEFHYLGSIISNNVPTERETLTKASKQLILRTERSKIGLSAITAAP